ncbi:MAG: tetratricopeptide repeat protein [Gammaproteobacteria bacterium]|nr:tetratricopeptide repeat protein [Gammaproteobacteria bacterium]
MDEFQSEKEQIEEIKKWWQANGSFIVTGLILGVGALAGWKYWQHYDEQRASTASAYYDELTQAMARNDQSGATNLQDTLKEKYSATPYASQASLAMAKLYVQGDKPEQAAEELRSVIETAKDEYLAMVARVRLARVLSSLDRVDEALQVLAVADPGNFAARFHDVRGDLYAKKNQVNEAKIEYLSALDLFEPGLLDRQLVEMKLSDLEGAAPADTPANPDA